MQTYPSTLLIDFRHYSQDKEQNRNKYNAWQQDVMYYCHAITADGWQLKP
jgi:hypothetical protein